MGLLWGLKELILLKCLEQCLAHYVFYKYLLSFICWVKKKISQKGKYSENLPAVYTILAKYSRKDLNLIKKEAKLVLPRIVKKKSNTDLFWGWDGKMIFFSLSLSIFCSFSLEACTILSLK